MKKIIFVIEFDGQLQYLVKWTRIKGYDLVLAAKINEIYPKTVIRFYEHKFKWYDNSNNDDDIMMTMIIIILISYHNEDISESIDYKLILHSNKIPEKVIGTTIYHNQFLYLIKWKNIEETDLITSEVANIICPQIIIKFCLDKIEWRDD